MYAMSINLTKKNCNLYSSTLRVRVLPLRVAITLCNVQILFRLAFPFLIHLVRYFSSQLFFPSHGKILFWGDNAATCTLLVLSYPCD